MTVNFKDNSQEVLDALARAKRNALTAIGMLAETHAKEGTPVDTGRLRNSITYATSSYSGIGTYKDKQNNTYDDATALSTPEEGKVYIGTNVEYAPYVEDGGSHNKANHMLRRAATEHGDEYKELSEKALKNV